MNIAIDMAELYAPTRYWVETEGEEPECIHYTCFLAEAQIIAQSAANSRGERVIILRDSKLDPGPELVLIGEYEPEAEHE